jgi:hypothetical protein
VAEGTAPTDFAAASMSLAGIEALDVAALQTLYRLECSGEDFYNLLADRIGNEQAADLLRRNGREELGHARRIRRAISLKLGHEYEPEGEVLERFTVSLPDTVGPELLPFIVEGDNEPGPDVARLLRLNGREETLHGERVSQAIAILQGR